MQEISTALGISDDYLVTGRGDLPSRFAVTELAVTSFGAIGQAMASLVETLGLTAQQPEVTVNRRLASLWFSFTIRPEGWELPPVWDAIAGDYRATDGWIKLHTNLPHHKAAACRVLGVNAERALVEATVGTWRKDDLEAEIVAAGGVAAAMYSRQEWKSHDHGKCVKNEPLIDWHVPRHISAPRWTPSLARPLAGLKMLDLTRVLAGPVATRTLAGFGAEVLRIDPPNWEEDNVVPDITRGKRCARLDLNNQQDRETFEHLIRGADMLVHGYRPGALEGLGFGDTQRRRINPDLIEICLDAYGWTGPWAGRRGFDSLVQMSSGIAHAGMQWAKAELPTPLPVQALDFSTGYLMAAAAIRLIENSVRGAPVSSARLSLARTADMLAAHKQSASGSEINTPLPEDYISAVEDTPWGSARWLTPPIKIGPTKLSWDRSSCELGSSSAHW